MRFPSVLHQLSIRGISSELIIIGRGSLRPQLENLLHDPPLHDIKDKIIFFGHHYNVANLLRSSIALVIPSRSEGFPNVLLEAWSLGVPVVASTDSLSATDINSSSVLFYDNSLNSDLADKMVNITLSSSLRSNLISNGAAIVREFDSMVILPQWIELLTSPALSDS